MFLEINMYLLTYLSTYELLSVKWEKYEKI